MPNNNVSDNDTRGFVVTEPLIPQPKVGYIPSRNDSIFSDSSGEAESIGYELDERDLLEKLKNARFPISVKECDSFWVKEAIGGNYTNWISDIPIFISAQTGSGKNTFIEERLIPFIKDTRFEKNIRKEILILSNRIALNAQVKKRIENTGVAKVMMYQGFMSYIRSHKSFDNYQYIVCDECHFFTSDAMFNPNTAVILDGIIRNFQHAVRIYMSATFTDCLEFILGYELRIYRQVNSRPAQLNNKVKSFSNLEFKYFILQRDYTYFDIRYYNEHMDLKDIIIRSLMNNEKWLIFIDNIKMCEELKSNLLAYYKKEYGNENGSDKNALLADKDIMLIDAGSKSDDEYTESIVNEKFACKILISTSVIDNGINLFDDALKHIVISDVSKSKCLQMVGRKRIDRDKHGTPMERVNLYLKIFNEQYIENNIFDLEDQREAYGLYNRAYKSTSDTENKGWEILADRRKFQNQYYNDKSSDFEKAKRWFYRDYEKPEIVHPDDIAVSLVDNVLLPRYRYILERMKKKESAQEFLEVQLGWFREFYDIANDISSQKSMGAKEEFQEFVTGLLGKIIPKAEQKEFGMSFFEKYERAYGLRRKEDGFKGNDNTSRTEVYGKNIINEIFALRNIGLVIESNKNEGWKIKEKT